MAGPDEPIYRTTLSPHRSMTRGQARVLIAGAGLVSTGLSIPFFFMGAWPVGGFFGLDVAALALAFNLSFRSARATEDLLVTPLEVVLAKVTAGGRRREWRFNPIWVRVLRRDHEEFGLQHLAIASRGRQVEVAGFLGPAQRETVARDLTRALHEARRGPRFPDD